MNAEDIMGTVNHVIGSIGIVKVIHDPTWEGDGHGGGQFQVEVEVKHDDNKYILKTEVDDGDDICVWQVLAKKGSGKEVNVIAHDTSKNLQTLFLFVVARASNEPAVRQWAHDALAKYRLALEELGRPRKTTPATTSPPAEATQPQKPDHELVIVDLTIFARSTVRTLGCVKYVHPFTHVSMPPGTADGLRARPGHHYRATVDLTCHPYEMELSVNVGERVGVLPLWYVKDKDGDQGTCGSDVVRVFASRLADLTESPGIKAWGKAIAMHGSNGAIPADVAPQPAPIAPSASAPTQAITDNPPAPPAPTIPPLDPPPLGALGSLTAKQRAHAILRVRAHLAETWGGDYSRLICVGPMNFTILSDWRIAEDGEAADVVCQTEGLTLTRSPNSVYTRFVEVELLDFYHAAARLRVARGDKPGMSFVQLTVAEGRGKTPEQAADSAVYGLSLILADLYSKT